VNDLEINGRDISKGAVTKFTWNDSKKMRMNISQDSR